MKPVQLTMQAFGSYGKRTVLSLMVRTGTSMQVQAWALR